MTVRGVLSTVLVSLCWMFASAADSTNGTTPGSTTTTRAAAASSSGVTPTNSSTSSGGKATTGLLNGLGVDGSMIQRALYVLIGITIIGVLYFLIRAVRLKKPAQRKKYGLLSNYDDSVEMEAVESDEDDTLYEARSLRR